jgi:16S rRNA (uracil1498-N3)-methyltransferase
VRVPRLLVRQPLGENELLQLDAAPAHYLRTVLRLRSGATVLAFNGCDGEWACTLEVAGRTTLLQARRQERAQAEEPGPALLFAPIKRPRLEWLVEKAVELGARRLVPVLTERTVVRLEGTDRLHARIVEAAEQCGRLTVPELAEPTSLRAALGEPGALGLVAFADEAGGAEPLAELLARRLPDALLVGPEGGLAPEERRWLRARPDIRPVSLGPRILRAETAALCMVGAWSQAAVARG